MIGKTLLASLPARLRLDNPSSSYLILASVDLAASLESCLRASAAGPNVAAALVDAAGVAGTGASILEMPDTPGPWKNYAHSLPTFKTRDFSVGRWGSTVPDRIQHVGIGGFHLANMSSPPSSNGGAPDSTSFPPSPNGGVPDNTSSPPSSNGGAPENTSSVKPDSSTQNMILVSDSESYSAFQHIDGQVSPRSRISGLIAAFTPFVNGHKHTVYLGQDLVTGPFCLGIQTRASLGGAPSFPPSRMEDHLAANGGGRITNCRGNVILELDTDAAISRLPLLADKEKVLYARVGLEGGEELIGVYRVIAGDPSRQSFALDCVHDLRVGMTIEFVSLDPSAIASESHLQSALVCLDKGLSLGRKDLLAGSESGVIWRNGMGETQVCDVPGAGVSLL
ncbi:MAG: hypothetical protein SGCHY_005379 [Lobulomycetales sp.]